MSDQRQHHPSKQASSRGKRAHRSPHHTQKHTQKHAQRRREPSPEQVALEQAWEEALIALAQRLGYEAPSPLLREALTHRSYLNEHPHVGADNQRLEFLGDALLGVTVTLALWPRLTHANEGELSATRARLINATTLARSAERVGLEACLRVGKGEPNMGEKAREARLADALEALIGALTLDLGEAHARAWLWSLLSEEFETLQAQLKEGGALLNVKSRLLHLAQRLTTHTPRYERLPQTEAEQSKHPPLIKVRVWVGDEILGEGEDTLRQRAEERAAEVALEALTRSEGRLHQTTRSPHAPSKRSISQRQASRKRHSSRS